MEKQKCKTCLYFNQYYYKSKMFLVPSAYGKCAKKIVDPAKTQEVCDCYRKKDPAAVLKRRDAIFDSIQDCINSVNNMLLILSSDEKENGIRL